MQNPWMHTVALTSSGTPYNLYALMSAIDPAAPLSCVFLILQSNPAGSGAKYYIGNAGMSDTDYGFYLTAGQSVSLHDQSGDKLISTKSIWLLSDTSSQTFNVTAIEH
jgi:hypothetical protein